MHWTYQWGSAYRVIKQIEDDGHAPISRNACSACPADVTVAGTTGRPGAGREIRPGQLPHFLQRRGADAVQPRGRHAAFVFLPGAREGFHRPGRSRPLLRHGVLGHCDQPAPESAGGPVPARACSIACQPFFISSGGNGATSGFGRWLIAMPQYAMAQEGSWAARAVKAFTVSGKKNECSMATARLNCVCAAALQEMRKLTRPNFSSCAWAAGCASNSNVGRTSRTGVPRNWGMVIVLDLFDHTVGAPPLICPMHLSLTYQCNNIIVRP